MRTAEGLQGTTTETLSECLENLIAGKDNKRPISTYRFQLNAGFRFEDARQLLPYLHALGVSHCYASPILQARAGSQHGYDIINHNEINPEIGTKEEFDRFVEELHALGMGLILDIVPNHMGVGHGTNPWWQDVMENGQASAHADFFDIDWSPLKQELQGKVLLPVLGDAYGEELEQGRLKLVYERGSFAVTYYDKRFPIDPQTYPLIFDQVPNLRERGDANWQNSEYPLLQIIINGLRGLAPHDSRDAAFVQRRQRELPMFREQLSALVKRSQTAQEVIAEALRKCNGNAGEPRSFDPLHSLLEAQAYRLADWRVSVEEINYRRFFDVNDLVGLRMENPAVFAATHQLVRRMLAEGQVDGIRLDHPDGLFNPQQYFTRIQMLYCASRCCGSEPKGALAENGIEKDVMALFGSNDIFSEQAPLFVLVEKILEPGEHLPREWPVDGTVGYDFGNSLNNVLINQKSKDHFTNFYHRFIGGPVDVNNLIYESKRLIMRYSLASELNVLMHMLDEISSTDRHARDLTRSLLREAIRETISCFPVYRTYIDARGNVSERDRGYIQEAIARAKFRNRGTNPAAFEFLRRVLLLESTDGTFSTEAYRQKLRFTLKFQQLTGPVMAKGLEDTACYVYSRFISVNEVGGSPAEFGISLQEFHKANAERARDWPYSMLGTSTHDSKRSEDVRARLNVLSEMPKHWSSQVVRWRRANSAKKKILGDGRAVPDPNEEYFLYQTLVGAWPFSLDDEKAREEFVGRIQRYMSKAVHEAKVNLSWISPNQEYVDGLNQFIERILRPGTATRPNSFLQQFRKFLEPVKFFGCINGLTQVLLKITCPGVPDIYRGCETWDLSLVDPDNRRPIDYDARQRMLRELLEQERSRSGDPTSAEEGQIWGTGRGVSENPTSANRRQIWGTGRGVSENPTSANRRQIWGTDRNVSENPTSAEEGQMWGTGRDVSENPTSANRRQIWGTETKTNTGTVAFCAEMLKSIYDGRAKMWTTMRALRFRRDHADIFRRGDYIPLSGLGVAHEHVIAFLRQSEAGTAAVLAPRLSYTLMKGEMRMPIGSAWGDALVPLPEGSATEWCNILTDEHVRAHDGMLLCREVFANFPIALLSAV